MVFYFTCEYKDPGGEPYIVYMGADKYENEGLIEWGQTRDVWFHVDGLSSAHVYLRLPLAAAQDAGVRCGDLLDRIPDPVVEEMCQLVKANSIEGCKRASVMVVWTPWANLHKDETCMQAGAVGFHDSKLRRLRRIDKDKSIVKKLEKTRREAHPDLQQERLQYERDAIRWRKNRDKANRDSKNAREKAERDAARREIEERHAARDAFLAAGRSKARGLGVEDFLIKPVQRLTKYPLFFDEVLALLGEHCVQVVDGEKRHETFAFAQKQGFVLEALKARGIGLNEQVVEQRLGRGSVHDVDRRAAHPLLHVDLGELGRVVGRLEHIEEDAELVRLQRGWPHQLYDRLGDPLRDMLRWWPDHVRAQQRWGRSQCRAGRRASEDRP